MTEVFRAIQAGWTPGGVGIWVLVIISIAAWWKGLPAVMDAWTNSVQREREHREREIARLEGQIIASDKRHADCEEAQRGLREEVNRLQGVISGMVVQMRQIQLSATSGEPIVVPPDWNAILKAMGGKA